MTLIQYDIVRGKGGWCIACGKLVGRPYALQQQALDDARFVADELKKAGEEVVITVEGRPARALH